MTVWASRACYPSAGDVCDSPAANSAIAPGEQRSAAMRVDSVLFGLGCSGDSSGGLGGRIGAKKNARHVATRTGRFDIKLTV